MRPPVVIALCVWCGACAPTDVEPPELITLDMISLNGLSVAALSDNAPALDQLSTGALDGAETALADSDAGRRLFAYITGCALPAGATAEIPLPEGGTLAAEGRLGFAPGWFDGPLDDVSQRWVSACVIAHVNAFSIPVPMSVRAQPLGEPAADESSTFEVQEAAFYGDLFAADPADRHMNACFGYHVAAEFGYDGDIDEDTLDYLQYRVCSTSDQCGFNRTGACFNWGPPILGTESRACDGTSDNLYVNCHDKPVEEGPSAAWAETVTIHLRRADFDRQVNEYLSADRPCSPLPSPEDAGIPSTPDAGTPPPQDAGTPPAPDAGLPPPPHDAGTPPIPDAGVPPSQDGGSLHNPKNGPHVFRASCTEFE